MKLLGFLVLSTIEGVFHALEFNFSLAFCLVSSDSRGFITTCSGRYCPSVIVSFLSVTISLNDDWDIEHNKGGYRVTHPPSVTCHECHVASCYVTES